MPNIALSALGSLIFIRTPLNLFFCYHPLWEMSERERERLKEVNQLVHS